MPSYDGFTSYLITINCSIAFPCQKKKYKNTKHKHWKQICHWVCHTGIQFVSKKQDCQWILKPIMNSHPFFFVVRVMCILHTTILILSKIFPPTTQEVRHSAFWYIGIIKVTGLGFGKLSFIWNLPHFLLGGMNILPKYLEACLCQF